MILLLSIRFLDDRYHGLTDNGQRREWPPSPFRVFQALVAGNARGVKLPPSIRAALDWLERLPAPIIIAPAKHDAPDLLTYVLNNVSDTSPDSRAQKVVRPTVLEGDRLLEYGWTFDTSVPGAIDHATEIARAARHIRCLGWGIDLAVGHGEITPKLSGVPNSRRRHCPAPAFSGGGSDLRVPAAEPAPGSLVSLERAHDDFLNRYAAPGVTRLESAGKVYEPCRYVTELDRPWVAFRLVDPDGKARSFRHQLIKVLTGTIRELAQRPAVEASLGKEVVARDVMGHPKDASTDRVSILPLPTVRDGPTDGRIRRLLIAQPPGSSGTLCRRLGEFFEGQTLKPKADEDRLPPTLLERIHRRDDVLPRYVGTSRAWASVTPVLLPGYDDRKTHRGDHVKRLERAGRLLRKAIAQAGLDAPVNIELTRVPYFTGSRHAREYDVRGKLSHYPRYHVRVEFEREVTGPLAIGAGRHVGFGVMATCTD
ncbi:MAG: type I-U CRISPR-associated protein Csb2 [Tepidisphaeraceae bacterium]